MMALTEDEVARLTSIDPAIAKIALERESHIAYSLRSGMLERTDSAGNRLYRVTSGGNIVRTKPITQGMKRRILNRDGRSCVECGSRDWLEVAHIEPYRVNGNNADDNLRTPCSDCHAQEDD